MKGSHYRSHALQDRVVTLFFGLLLFCGGTLLYSSVFEPEFAAVAPPTADDGTTPGRYVSR